MMQDRPEQNSQERSRFKKSKILRIISSALIAFCLWFYVISVERTETEQSYSDVEVVLDGEAVLEERGLKIISDKDLTVKLRLNGRRSVLNSLRSSDLEVHVDLTRIYEAGKKSLSYEIVFPGDVQSSAIEVVTRDPDTITLTVADWAEKRVDLKAPQIDGTPAEGYRVGDAITQEHETVKLSGPKEVIDRIASAGVTVDVDGVSESQEVRKSFVYYDAEGNVVEDTLSVTADPEKTLVRVPILKDKTVDLHMPITIGEGVTDTEFTVDVTVNMADGSQSSFAGTLMVEDGVTTLNGAALREDEDGNIYFDLGSIIAFGSPVSVDYVTEGELPELLLQAGSGEQIFTGGDIDLQQDGVSCDVTDVMVTVTSREKITKDIPGVSIDGVDPLHTCTPKLLTVTVKGFAEDLEDVTSGNILAVLEEQVTQTGIYDVVVTVVGHPDVTVVGSYPVRIEVPVARPTVDQLVDGDGTVQET